VKTALNLPFTAALGLILSSPLMPLAAAPEVRPGREGDLAKLVAPIHGRKACYARIYDSEHLKKNPRQQTKSLMLQIQYHYPEKREQHQQPYYLYRLKAQVKGQKAALQASGDCAPDGAKIRCSVECDGGEFFLELEKATGGLRLSLDQPLRMGSCGEEDNVEWGAGGKADDKVFRLWETNATCPSIDSETDR
jgi:hypothetical protein